MRYGRCDYKNITLYSDQGVYRFSYCIIKALGDKAREEKASVKAEVKAFFIRNWEDFGDAFLDHSLFHSQWLLLLYREEELIGVATLHKKEIESEVFYNFKTNALSFDYVSLGLLERMNQILFRFAYIDNLLYQRSLWFRMIFTTPNLRILGMFAKKIGAIYPDPYLYDEKKRSLPLPDEKTWRYVQAYNKIDYPPNLPLSKEACVVEDKKSKWPYVCYEKNGYPYYKEPLVNAFGEHYLGFKEGKRRMFVVCAFVSPWDVLRYFYLYLFKCIKKRAKRCLQWLRARV